MWKPNVKKFLEAKFAKWAWGLGFLSFASLLRSREPIFEKLHQKRLLMHSCSDSDAKSFFCFFPPLAANTVKKDLNLSKYICAWLKWTFYLIINVKDYCPSVTKIHIFSTNIKKYLIFQSYFLQCEITVYSAGNLVAKTSWQHVWYIFMTSFLF